MRVQAGVLVNWEGTRQRAEHDRLFREHYRTVVFYLARRLPVEDAKDLAAEVFVEAWRQRDMVVVDEERGWLPWLFTVARRMATAWLRRTPTTLDLTAHETGAGVEDFVERLVEVDAANQRLAAALAGMQRLGDQDREVLELCGLFHLTPAQAAIVLEVPAGTVRVRLHRARRRLAEVVDREEISL